HLGRGSAGEVLVREREDPEGNVRPGGYLPVFGVRILGILCAARVRGEITPHRRYRGVFPDSRFGKGRGLVRPRLSGAQPNQPLHLTAAALRFSVFNVSPAAAAGE